jgi:phage-related protein
MPALYIIKYYVTAKGDCPFAAFLEETQPRVKAKFIKILDLLSYQGPNLRRPHADVLRDGIREIRIRLGTNRYRALYFFISISRKDIIITHGILKKTDEVPQGEIEKALRYKKDLENRLSHGEVTL